MPDILIVEDGFHERDRLEKLFLGRGFTIESAESVGLAEELLSVSKFRLCILDIGLADKSGSLLFQTIRKREPSTLVIILTGNPSVYLKQKFLEEGAAGFVLKASQEAENDNLLATVTSLLGGPSLRKVSGIELADFLKTYIQESSRDLFLDNKLQIFPCSKCGKTNFQVQFDHKIQLPPVVEGRVVCIDCGLLYDPEVG